MYVLHEQGSLATKLNEHVPNNLIHVAIVNTCTCNYIIGFLDW